MCYVDLEPCEVWNERQRKARKSHRCECCRGTIAAGEMYFAHFSVFEGDATNAKMCLRCNTDRDLFAAAHDGKLPTPGGFYAMLRECISENDPDDDRWRPMADRIRQSRSDAQRRSES